MGAQWSVVEGRPRGCGFEPHQSLRCGPWARHIYPRLVLVQPRKTRPCLTERLLVARKESNQAKWSEVGRACPGTHQGTSWSVLLNVSYHKKHEYIWFRDGTGHAFGSAFESGISIFKLSCKTISIFIIAKKFQSNPLSGYWKIVQTKFGCFLARRWASLRV